MSSKASNDKIVSENRSSRISHLVELVEPIEANSGEYELFVLEDDCKNRTLYIARVDGSEIPWHHDIYLQNLVDEPFVSFAKKVRWDRFEVHIGERGAFQGVDYRLVQRLVEVL